MTWDQLQLQRSQHWLRSWKDSGRYSAEGDRLADWDCDRIGGKNEERHPNLAKAAKRLHSFPSTSMPSECIFSNAVFIVSKIRSSCLPNNVDKLVFLSHNMRKLRLERKNSYGHLYTNCPYCCSFSACFCMFCLLIFIKFVGNIDYIVWKLSSFSQFIRCFIKRLIRHPDHVCLLH